jgi:hypothetical protein
VILLSSVTTPFSVPFTATIPGPSTTVPLHGANRKERNRVPSRRVGRESANENAPRLRGLTRAASTFAAPRTIASCRTIRSTLIPSTYRQLVVARGWDTVMRVARGSCLELLDEGCELIHWNGRWVCSPSLFMPF